DRGEAVDHLLHRRGEGVVGSIHVGPQSVAAAFRNNPGIEDRAQGRAFTKCHVGVPLVIIDPLAAVVLEDADLRMLGQMCEYWVRWFQLSEAPGERQMVFRAQTLIAEYDHQAIVECSAYGRKYCIVDARKVDINYFSADRGRDRANVESNRGHVDRRLRGGAWEGPQMPAAFGDWMRSLQCLVSPRLTLLQCINCPQHAPPRPLPLALTGGSRFLPP